MSEGCPGCFQSQRGIDERLSVYRVQARALAVEKGKPIAIVQDAGEFYLLDAFLAVQNNCLIKEVVSNV
jgi:hypothetical protein